MEERVCQRCGGAGGWFEPELTCCRVPLPSGECCGSAVEEVVAYQCDECNGTGLEVL